MDDATFEQLRRLNDSLDDPRAQRLLAHFGCYSVSAILLRLWSADDIDEKRRIEHDIARILDAD